jgi:hypothetical protein
VTFQLLDQFDGQAQPSGKGNETTAFSGRVRE